MAVQGATPSRIMPAIYSLADCGSTSPANRYSKKRMPSAAIVNGFINQLTTSVMQIPFGFLPTSFSDAKSTFTIIG